MNYQNFVRSYPDFPKEGVLFWDFSYLLRDVQTRKAAVQDMKAFLADKHISKIAAIESKGFTLGSILAHELGLPLVLVRKPGLTPGEYSSEQFIKEYGVGEYQLKADAIAPDERVAIVYDILAGAGASQAAVNLISRAGGQTAALLYITELEYLGGRQALVAADIPDSAILSLVKIQAKDDLLPKL